VGSNFYFSALYSRVPTTEPELFRGYNPNKTVFNQEVELIHDLEPIEVAGAEAEKFKYEHSDRCDILAGEGGQWFVKFKKGAYIFVPKAFKLSRTVTGQIPTGWDAGRYGIPADIIAQTDRATLWALVCTAEALNKSGLRRWLRWLRESCEGVQGSSGGERGPK
jgi:fatty acid synthase subunit alpha, fungi type